MPKIDADMVKCLGFVSLRSMENVEVDTIDLTLLNLNIERARWKGLIQGIYEFDIFSICLPGYEIQVCLDSKVKGSFISFTAPSNIPNSKIIGLNVCSVFTFSGEEETWDHPPLFTKISNKSEGETWTYGPSYYGIPEDGKHMIRLSHWKSGDELEAGDEVDVCVVVGVGFRVVLRLCVSKKMKMTKLPKAIMPLPVGQQSLVEICRVRKRIDLES